MYNRCFTAACVNTLARSVPKIVRNRESKKSVFACFCYSHMPKASRHRHIFVKFRSRSCPLACARRGLWAVFPVQRIFGSAYFVRCLDPLLSLARITTSNDFLFFWIRGTEEEEDTPWRSLQQEEINGCGLVVAMTLEQSVGAPILGMLHR
jgi:hypothetical protein